jgi:methyltransferase family protein
LKTVSACPICGSSGFRSVSRAIVAPFLARRVWGRESFPAAVTCCGVCDFVFFNPRLEPHEEARLYHGYRDTGYLRARHAVEPWYTERFHANLTDPAFLGVRKARVAEILQGYLPGDRSYKILDFGGSQGELVQGLLPNFLPYVYDISKVQPLAGVTPCADLADCQRHEFDLIVCSNVLEHVGSPHAIIDRIRQIATPTTLLWVEVPQQTPFGWEQRLRRLAQEAVLLVLRPRVGIHLLRPGVLHWMHEHVNFFNAKSLQALLRTSGWEVLSSEVYVLRSPLGSEKMVWAIGRLASGSLHDGATT